jgi:RNA polymerase sigma-70 factor (ECF subfamily)
VPIALAEAFMNQRISYPARHFPAVLFLRSLWQTDCLFQWQLLRDEVAGRFGFMETSYGTGINKDSDGALVAAAKHGDTHAFEELVLRHKRRVLSVAQRITNNREDAEDVAQESFHKVFLHLDAFQEKSRFSTWLTRIVMNEAYMLLRRRRRVLEVWPESPDDTPESVSTEFVDQRPSPEESCWHRERTKLLTEAINRLGPTIRRTMLFRDIEERSVEETAQILGTSISAVKARVFQGRRKLRGTVNRGLLWGVCSASRAETQAVNT